MRKPARCIISAILLVLTAGCVGVPVALDQSYIAQNKIEEIVVVVRQPELEVQQTSTATNSLGAGLGLIGVLVGAAVDAGVNSNRGRSIKDVVAAMGDWDFEAVFLEKMEAAEFSFVKELKVVQGTDLDLTPGIPTLSAYYFLANDRNTLLVTGEVLLDQHRAGEELEQQPVGRDDVGKEKESTIYRGVYSSTQYLSSNYASDMKKEDKTAVLVDQPGLVTKALEAGMDEVISLFEQDFKIY